MRARAVTRRRCCGEVYVCHAAEVLRHDLPHISISACHYADFAAARLRGMREYTMAELYFVAGCSAFMLSIRFAITLIFCFPCATLHTTPFSAAYIRRAALLMFSLFLRAHAYRHGTVKCYATHMLYYYYACRFTRRSC